MATDDRADPTVSAVVQMADAGEREAAGAPGLHDNQATAQTKSFLTKAGFEVHAPFQTSFSIGAAKSLFEEFFGRKLVVEEGLIASVTVDDGGRELPVDALPDEVRPLVRSISFVPPPDFTNRAPASG
ncbi:MAG TPA: hypothetical protein VHG90_12505 [Acidimicrobiales bacterium]|nr:hypothetical protein [Acidimicrobiales bacterium]